MERRLARLERPEARDTTQRLGFVKNFILNSAIRRLAQAAPSRNSPTESIPDDDVVSYSGLGQRYRNRCHGSLLHRSAHSERRLINPT
jgi:hypothetical protein